MTYIVQTIHKFGKRFNTHAEWLACCHPCLAFFSMFVGVPVFILSAVGICTTAIVLPISLLMGWV